MELVRKLLSTLFPSRCLLCQKTVVAQLDNENIEICPDCLRQLPYNENSCRQCALPLAIDLEEEVLCGRCMKNPPAFDYSYSPLRYEGDIVRLVHQLKFNEKITVSRSLSEIMLKYLSIKMAEQGESHSNSPDCLLPVPLHNSRLRQRGFNQSIELARVVAKQLNIPIEFDAISRRRSTTSQMGLDAKQRRKNIKGAFLVVKEVSARHVLIIDDVMTTGSTVDELARTLKKSGVEKVGVLSFSRAPIRN